MSLSDIPLTVRDPMSAFEKLGATVSPGRAPASITIVEQKRLVEELGLNSELNKIPK